MKLIPTPQKYHHSGSASPITGFQKILCQIFYDDTLRWGLAKLAGIAPMANTAADTLILQKADHPFFQEKNAEEQGYILTRNGDTLTLTAQTSIGFLYGLMTLRQLCKQAPAQFEIYDRPQIRFRGNMNTLWAETAVWSYDFGDGLEAGIRRVKTAIDQAAMYKLNMMYVDAFGFRTERFPGYDQTMRALAEYGRVRGVRMMIGGYSMGYGLSALGNFYMGKVFYNRYPYPDGELYDCIGRCGYSDDDPVDTLTGRQHGTCLSNDALTDDKIEEMRAYLRATGARMIYMHNMDADEIHKPLWLGRCVHCRERFPNDDLYARDGCAGAFAEFYDRILDALLPEFPDLIICPVSPGYAYAYGTNDASFEQCRKFWAAVMTYCKGSKALIPLFRELFHQWDGPELRFELLAETVPAFGCIFFSSSDGHYSDKIYTPSGAYAAVMKDCDLVICANGGALQKPIQLTNAEYLWNPDHSAFWNLEIPKDYKSCLAHYDAFREGVIRPDEIYGDNGLLETTCALLFGEKVAKRVADVFRLQGKNGECPIFTACNTELWTKGSRVNYPMLWDTPVAPEQQAEFLERFSQSAIVTQQANVILKELLAENLDADTREHLAFLEESTGLYTVLCQQLTEYMQLYIQADRYFADGTAVEADFYERCDRLAKNATAMLEKVQNDGRKAFDPLGGVIWRRDDLFDFIAYCAGQMVKSLRTGQRVPEDRRPLRTKDWW